MVQELLGHADITTTQKYIEVRMTTLHAAVATVSKPSETRHAR